MKWAVASDMARNGIVIVNCMGVRGREFLIYSILCNVASFNVVRWMVSFG